mgnify:CR=1 FL=1
MKGDPPRSTYEARRPRRSAVSSGQRQCRHLRGCATLCSWRRSAAAAPGSAAGLDDARLGGVGHWRILLVLRELKLTSTLPAILKAFRAALARDNPIVLPGALEALAVFDERTRRGRRSFPLLIQRIPMSSIARRGLAGRQGRDARKTRLRGFSIAPMRDAGRAPSMRSSRLTAGRPARRCGVTGTRNAIRPCSRAVQQALDERFPGAYDREIQPWLIASRRLSWLRPNVSVLGRAWSCFQICGVVGLTLGTWLALTLVSRTGLSPAVVVVLLSLGVLTFLVLAMATKVVTGHEVARLLPPRGRHPFGVGGSACRRQASGAP